MRISKIYLFVIACAIIYSGCKSKVNPNEWYVSTSTCWNTMTVTKSGKPVPRLLTTCDRGIVLPATQLAAEFKTETKFGNRLAGAVEMTYQWRITDPVVFIGSAKSLTSSGSNEFVKVNPDVLEQVENAVVDKMIINLIREHTPTIAPQDIDELTMEKDLKKLADEQLADRGIAFENLSINVNLSPQAEEAMDVISALEFYRANGEEELGRKIIEAKAGATNIVIEK